MAGWTAVTREQLTLAETLWNAGELTARQIGAEVGMTHNAVIGHARRRGWAKRGSPIGVTRPKTAAPKAARSPKAAKARQADIARRAPSIRPVIDWSAILAADPRGCQWIEGDALVDPTPCGVPSVDGCSWCAEHRRRVFTSAEHPAAIAPALDAQVAVGCPPLMRCGSQRGTFLSVGAEVRASVRDGEGLQPLPVEVRNVLSEPSVHAHRYAQERSP
jgi:hypothetical protein